MHRCNFFELSQNFDLCHIHVGRAVRIMARCQHQVHAYLLVTPYLAQKI